MYSSDSVEIFKFVSTRHCEGYPTVILKIYEGKYVSLSTDIANVKEITGSLRLTLGIQNTVKEIDATVNALVEIVGELRKVSPYGLKYN